MDWADRIGRRLKLRDLHILHTVVQCRSMAKAALQLSVSSPVVSKTISDLEHTVGLRLLDRGPQGIEPTIYGRALLDRSMIAFDELREAVRHVEFLADPTSGEVRVAIPPAFATDLGVAIIDRFTRLHPGIVVHVSTGVWSTNYRDLHERRLDLVIESLIAPVTEEHLQAELLYDQALVVVAGSQSRWSRRRKISLGDLMDEVWTLPPQDSPFGVVVAEAFKGSGFAIPRTTVVAPRPMRNALVATGRFVSMTSAPLRKVGSPGIKVLPIDLPTARLPIAIVTPRNRTISPVAQVFIDCARKVARRLGRW